MTIPKKMKAAVLVAQRQPLVIADLELPKGLAVGQVLVKIHYSGICGSQLGEIEGVKGEDKYLPHLLGHEGSGVVLEVGPGVRHVSSGDSVVLHWRKGIGIESPVPEYKWDGRTVNAGWVTTFNEYAVVSENRLTKIPEGTDMAVAALFGCAVTTGFGAVVNNAKVKIGDSVVVFGAGGVGLNIVQASAMSSAFPIIAVDLYDNRLTIAKKAGATHVINASTSDVRAKIRDIVGGGGVDVFVDNTGRPDAIELGYAITKSQGCVTLVGVPKFDENTTLHTLPLHFGKRVCGSHGGEATPHEDIPRYLELYRQGKLDLSYLVTDLFSLSKIDLAINGMRIGTLAGRALIDLR